MARTEYVPRGESTAPPMLTVSETGAPSQLGQWSRTAVSMRLTSALYSSASVSGATIANSSPPYRAIRSLLRVESCSAPAMHSNA
jgi:hypothetical protein